MTVKTFAFLVFVWILLWTFFWLNMLDYFVYYHESAHLQIYNLYGINAQVKYEYLETPFGRFKTAGSVVNHTEIPNFYKNYMPFITALQIENEITGYHFMALINSIYFIIFFLGILILYYTEKRYDYEN